MLNGIIDGTDYTDKNEKIDASIRRTMKIKNFYGKDSEEVKYEKDFEMYCVVLSKHTNKHVKELTTKEYFSLRKYVEDDSKRRRRK